jgi:hypothetical protein
MNVSDATICAVPHDGLRREGFHLIDDGCPSPPPISPRSIEILSVLNDVFDGLVVDATGVVATATTP